MLRVYEKYVVIRWIVYSSHSIDPTFDTQESPYVDYFPKTGNRRRLYLEFPYRGFRKNLFESDRPSYLTTAMADQAEPGGFSNSVLLF